MSLDKINKSVVLASKSPRRAEILAMAGVDFQVVPADIDESVDPSLPVQEQALITAKRKALAVQEMLPGDMRPIISCDTVVLAQGQVLGKPADAQDARRMLELLSGQESQVVSGVCILAQNRESSFTQVTDVQFREMTNCEIDRYIESGEPFDKAGAYGIQGKAGIFIEGICGDYYNVVGLPLCRLMQELEKIWEDQED